VAQKTAVAEKTGKNPLASARNGVRPAPAAPAPLRAAPSKAPAHDIRRFVDAPVQRAAGGVIQRAGHAEDFYRLANGTWFVKKADAAETLQYQGFTLLDRQSGAIPEFCGPYQDANALLGDGNAAFAGDLNANTDLAGITALGLTLGGTDRLIVLKSATGGDPAASLRDLKLGRHTASGTDQALRGESWLSQKVKAMRHDVLDTLTPSRELGFRDEDATKELKYTTESNLADLRHILGNSSLEALQKIKLDITNIAAWVTGQTTVYVGASVLLVANNQNAQASNAVMIDFAHPVTAASHGQQRFNNYKQDMIDGLVNISHMIEAEIMWCV
jgi:hypothetical protein